MLKRKIIYVETWLGWDRRNDFVHDSVGLSPFGRFQRILRLHHRLYGQGYFGTDECRLSAASVVFVVQDKNGFVADSAIGRWW